MEHYSIFQNDWITNESISHLPHVGNASCMRSRKDNRLPSPFQCNNRCWLQVISDLPDSVHVYAMTTIVRHVHFPKCLPEVCLGVRVWRHVILEYGDECWPSKCWHLGRAQNHYYYATMTCIKYRNPGFKTELHLTGVAGRLEGGLVLTNELWRELWERFGQAIFY